MRKSLSILLAVLVSCLPFIAFSACSDQTDAPPVEMITGNERSTPAQTGKPAEAPTPEPPQIAVQFENGLSSALDEVYINSANTGDWGQPVIRSIGPGESSELSFGCGLPAFDIGTLSADGVDYDAFGVKLFDGDTVILTGDWESGIFTVVHSDGSKDFYTAKVYWSPSEQAAEPINLSAQTASETVTDETGAAVGTVSYQRIILDPKTAERFPELAAAVDELNSARRTAVCELLSEAGSENEGKSGENDGPAGTAVAETVTICRSDSVLISLLYETRQEGAEQSCFTGVNIDPEAGALLTPADIVTDVQKLPHLINLKLAETESGLEINEYRDHVGDFSKQSQYYALVIKNGGIEIIFNVNAFRSGITETVRIRLEKQDDPFLIRPRYLPAE